MKPDPDTEKYKITDKHIEFTSSYGGVFIVAQMDPDHGKILLNKQSLNRFRPFQAGW